MIYGRDRSGCEKSTNNDNFELFLLLLLLFVLFLCFFLRESFHLSTACRCASQPKLLRAAMAGSCSSWNDALLSSLSKTYDRR